MADTDADRVAGAMETFVQSFRVDAVSYRELQCRPEKL